MVALASKNRDHIPYRQSKLTHVLKDSLGGNCETLMIACIWPNESHIDQTISTLKFAERMMCVKNKPVVNEVKVGGKGNERLGEFCGIFLLRFSVFSFLTRFAICVNSSTSQIAKGRVGHVRCYLWAAKWWS